MKKPLIIIGIGVLAIGGFLVGRHFYIKNKDEGSDSLEGGSSSSANVDDLSLDEREIFPLGMGSGMGSSVYANSTVRDLQEALNKLAPSPMLLLEVDGKYGDKTQAMLIAVGQKYTSLDIGETKLVSEMLFNRIIKESKGFLGI